MPDLWSALLVRPLKWGTLPIPARALLGRLYVEGIHLMPGKGPFSQPLGGFLTRISSCRTCTRTLYNSLTGFLVRPTEGAFARPVEESLCRAVCTVHMESFLVRSDEVPYG